MNKMMILSALAALQKIFNLSAHNRDVQPRNNSAFARRTPCTASQTHHVERHYYE